MGRYLSHLASTFAVGISLTCAAWPSASEARSGAGTFNLRARVPVACWIQPAGEVQAQTDIGGSVIEACNNPGGFIVAAIYRPLVMNEAAQLVYDGTRLNLAPSGNQLLRSSSTATIRTVDYRFEEVRLESPLILSLTIQPV
ncbi:hypothetical protein [Qipengyuania sp. MTN3-11]|uniref:hypothetical protein n=1 Tax=Qipengyuania sp. MTN3-11 TaxID=3056557 RepID=UPI0036F43C4F